MVFAALTGSSVLLTMAFLAVVLVIVPARRTPSTVPVKPVTDNAAEETQLCAPCRGCQCSIR